MAYGTTERVDGAEEVQPLTHEEGAPAKIVMEDGDEAAGDASNRNKLVSFLMVFAHWLACLTVMFARLFDFPQSCWITIALVPKDIVTVLEQAITSLTRRRRTCAQRNMLMSEKAVAKAQLMTGGK